ncbi:MAG TPA: hypothetical protein VHC49_21595 [Mycobacteriales bacterium]|nr:hypothetical protein [Mycobacteriales bacterium]
MSAMTMRPARTPFRTVQWLIGLYFGIGFATLVAAILLRNHHDEVNAAVWIRTSAVVLSALALAAFRRRAEAGSASAFRRLRIIATVTPIVIAVIVALPGTFPLWMKIDQIACGLVMAAVAVIVSRLRGTFAA